MSRKSWREMSDAELEAIDNVYAYTRGRADAFDHGKPETILEYLDREDPSKEELLVIIRNILTRMQ